MQKIVVDKSLFSDIFAKREENTAKWDYGRLFMYAGSYAMAGSLILAAKSALKMGVGLLDILCDDKVYNIASNHLIEPIFCIYKEDFDKIDTRLKVATSILCGPGIGFSDKSHSLVAHFINYNKLSIVLDADALNIMSHDKYMLESLKRHDKDLVITPHIREFSRLTGKKIEDIQNNREKYALEFAQKYGIIVILKGHNTVISFPDLDDVFINPTGNAGMAKGGSGDVLAGMISSLMAQGIATKKACLASVYIHGLMGDFAKEKFGEISFLPSEMIDFMPEIIKDFY